MSVSVKRPLAGVAVDGAVVLCFCGLLVSGMMLQYVPSGVERTAIWSVDRVGWTRIHLGLVSALLLLVIVEVPLRWRSMLAVFAGRSPGGPGDGIGIVIVLIGLVALAVLPLV
jgi:hypothetical protein